MFTIASCNCHMGSCAAPPTTQCQYIIVRSCVWSDERRGRGGSLQLKSGNSLARAGRFM